MDITASTCVFIHELLHSRVRRDILYVHCQFVYEPAFIIYGTQGSVRDIEIAAAEHLVRFVFSYHSVQDVTQFHLSSYSRTVFFEKILATIASHHTYLTLLRYIHNIDEASLQHLHCL